MPFCGNTVGFPMGGGDCFLDDISQLLSVGEWNCKSGYLSHYKLAASHGFEP